MMGGVVCDLHGRSDVPGLYAVGETSCTGLHGANRLASNSLSECFVWGRRAAHAALDEPAGGGGTGDELTALRALAPPPVASEATRTALWRDAGIERDAQGLQRLSRDAHPLARMIARSALARGESRGAHHRADHPERSPALDGQHALMDADEQLQWQTWE